MISRLLRRQLEAGIATLLAKPSIIAAHFECNLEFSQEEALEVQEAFVERPPSVIIQYPREDSQFPLWAIILGNEHESQRVLDDFSGFATNVPPRLGVSESAIVRSAVWEHSYDIWTVTDNPDLTAAYYQIAKMLVMRQRDALRALGVLTSDMQGRDLRPDETYLPAWLFARTLVFSGAKQQKAFDEGGFIIQNIRGIHVQVPGVDVTPDTGVEVRVGMRVTADDD